MLRGRRGGEVCRSSAYIFLVYQGAVLFTVAKKEKQPACPSAGEWIQKTREMEYYAAMKRPEFAFSILSLPGDSFHPGISVPWDSTAQSH